MEENATKKDIQDVLAVMQSNQESTKKDIQDVLEAISGFATNVEERFEIIDRKFDVIDSKFDGVDSKFDGIDKKLETIEHRLTSVESQMVTKAYLDDKLADMRGDLTMYDRKQDKKVDFLTTTLEKKKYLTQKEAEAVVVMSPFPQPPRVG